jgi:hypothetical protein
LKSRLIFLAIAAVLLIATLLARATEQHVHLRPKFASGQIIRYEIDTRMTTSGTMTSPIENPQGATMLKLSANMTVRVDILDAQSSASTPAGRIRLRATYEKSAASSETDAYDPQAAAISDQFNHLQGRSVEFTIEPDGRLSGISGLEDILANPSTAQSVRAWMTGLSSGSAFPPGGISISQKWSSEQPLTSTPLAGLFWRTESTYVRDEPCRSTSAAPDAADSAASADTCAVIVTRFEILRRGSRDDATPEDYRHNGLRTSGTWTGHGESLDSISISTGIVVSSTQTSTQDIDITITSAGSGSRLTYKGKVESQTDVKLLGPSAAPTADFPLPAPPPEAPAKP